jgi:hypothetical protein
VMEDKNGMVLDTRFGVLLSGRLGGCVGEGEGSGFRDPRLRRRTLNDYLRLAYERH